MPISLRPRANQPLPPGERRAGGALAVSVAAHLALLVALAWVFDLPYPLKGYFRDQPREELRGERITYVGVQQPPSPGPMTEGRIGGDGRPGAAERSVPLVAPSSVPDRLPPAVPDPAPSDAGEGTGPLIGGGGPVRGVRPSFGDGRLWVGPAPIVGAPKSPAERLDSSLVARLRSHQDSLAAIAGTGGRRPTDWTIERGGEKWGMDEQFIRLGPVSIPTAVLAALPLNVQGNPIAMEREARLNAMRAEILEQAQRGMNEEEFRRAVQQIRERKERERAREQELEARRRREAEQRREGPATR
jgi:hypothetical protein